MSRFTVVFEGDIRAFEGNPFLTDTPFGRPRVVEIGDAGAERDALVEALEGVLFQDSDITEQERTARYLHARQTLDDVQNAVRVAKQAVGDDHA